jgi:hypothetical protein
MDQSPSAERAEFVAGRHSNKKQGPDQTQTEMPELETTDVLDSSQRQRYLDELNPSGLMP